MVGTQLQARRLVVTGSAGRCVAVAVLLPAAAAGAGTWILLSTLAVPVVALLVGLAIAVLMMSLDAILLFTVGFVIARARRPRRLPRAVARVRRHRVLHASSRCRHFAPRF